jgi:hypothetical protein
VPAPAPQNLVVVSTPQALSYAAHNPLSLVFTHVLRSRLPFLTGASKRFSTATRLALYRTLELSADDADPYIAQLATLRHDSRPARLPAPPQRIFRANLMLRSMRAFSALTLPAFSAELLALRRAQSVSHAAC